MVPAGWAEQAQAAGGRRAQSARHRHARPDASRSVERSARHARHDVQRSASAAVQDSQLERGTDTINLTV